MKIALVVGLLAFLAFVVINEFRRRHYSESVYRARFRSRMPRRESDEPATGNGFLMMPVVMNSYTDAGQHAAPDCASHGVDAGGGGCSDGGGSVSH